MKPRILITSYHIEDDELQDIRPRGVNGQDMTMCTCDYSDAVYEAGGIPLVIPNINDGWYCDQLMCIADGVIFSGGGDVHPKYFGEQSVIKNLKIEEKRDAFELKLAQKILNSDIPILGICRGMQLLNVVAGGTLYQDIYEQAGITQKHDCHGQPRDLIIHNVNINKNSKLYDIYKCQQKGVNSYHHQGIKRLSNIFSATAFSEDGLIEAYEMLGKRFCICTQWHPEMMFRKHEIELSIFKALIEACTFSKNLKE